MGQYYLIVNPDKQQYLEPHNFNDGAKLTEFGSSGDGVMFGLAVLLADGNGRGGGDVSSSDDEIIGSWSGDRIVVAGDYADGLKFLSEEQKSNQDILQFIADKHYSPGSKKPEHVNLYAYAREQFTDISARVHKIIEDELLL